MLHEFFFVFFECARIRRCYARVRANGNGWILQLRAMAAANRTTEKFRRKIVNDNTTDNTQTHTHTHAPLTAIHRDACENACGGNTQIRYFSVRSLIPCSMYMYASTHIWYGNYAYAILMLDVLYVCNVCVCTKKNVPSNALWLASTHTKIRKFL